MSRNRLAALVVEAVPTPNTGAFDGCTGAMAIIEIWLSFADTFGDGRQ